MTEKSILNLMRKIVLDPSYLALKDYFVSTVPTGGESNLSTEVSHGKYLGTRFVFNQMEKEVKGESGSEKKKLTRGGVDPDLEE